MCLPEKKQQRYTFCALLAALVCTESEGSSKKGPASVEVSLWIFPMEEICFARLLLEASLARVIVMTGHLSP